MDVEQAGGVPLSSRRLRLSSLGDEDFESIRTDMMQKAREVSTGLIEHDEIDLPEWMSLTGDRVSTIFHALDADHDGRISFEALGKTLERYGLPTAGVESMCRMLDEDKSEDLDAKEFAAALREVLIQLLESEAGDEPCGMDIHEYSGPDLKKRSLKGLSSVRTVLNQEVIAWSMRPKLDNVSLAQPVHFESDGVRWFDVTGSFAMKCAAVFFGIHPVAVEDALSKLQKPKVERYDGNVFFVIPHFILHYDTTDQDQKGKVKQKLHDMRKKKHPDEEIHEDGRPRYTASNVCIFVDNRRFQDVVTFSLNASSSVVWKNRISSMLTKSYTRLRESNAQFLAYTMLDALVNSARPLVKMYRVSLIAERTKIRATRYSRPLRLLNLLNRDLVHIARICKHVMRLVNTIIETDKVLGKVIFYLRDVRDDLTDIEEDLATLLDECAAMQTEVEKFFQSRLDKTLFILTVISGIFLPLQFLSGVFGMNFRIPESDYKYSYHIFWAGSGLYILVAVIFLRLSNLKKYLSVHGPNGSASPH